jgi:hypothetical protein
LRDVKNEKRGEKRHERLRKTKEEKKETEIINAEWKKRNKERRTGGRFFASKPTSTYSSKKLRF